MDSQQKSQDELESKCCDFLNDFNSLLKEYGIDEPILNEQLDDLKKSNNFEISFSKAEELNAELDEIKRLSCSFVWEDGRLKIKCTRDM